MFQIGFGATPFEAGLMLLVYMAGNLAMKSITTPILRRFGFRDVIRVNGALCVASLVGCGLLSPLVPVPVVYGVLFVAGMTRSMHFTSMATLAFADIPESMRPGATTLAAMAQQVAGTLGVAVAALTLALFQDDQGGRATRAGRLPVRAAWRCGADGACRPVAAAASARRGRRTVTAILSIIPAVSVSGLHSTAGRHLPLPPATTFRFN